MTHELVDTTDAFGRPGYATLLGVLRLVTQLVGLLFAPAAVGFDIMSKQASSVVLLRRTNEPARLGTCWSTQLQKARSN